MNRNIAKALGIVAVAVALLGTFVPATYAENTLKKIGNAIQYTTRKDTENLATDVHRGTNSKSVVRNRHTGNNFVLKPNGNKIFKSTTKRHHHRHHHHKMG